MGLDLPKGWHWRGKLETDGSLLTRIGAARGMSDQDLATFIKPDFYSSWHDPKKLPDCTKAVKRLRQAVERRERVLVFGDYDADGIPATAIAVRALNTLGLDDVQAIIPTREAGYGLSASAASEIIAQKPDLVITVDTGVSSAEEIKLITQSGIDVIVTDHHESPEKRPDCLVVNPKLEGSKYPNRDLSGSGVVYKLLWALYESLGADLTSLKYLLDLVALATMADLMPLTPENRSLVVYGLTVMRRTKRVGLRALLLTGEIAPSQVDYRHLSFFLAPRLNAISRLGLDKVERHERWGSIALALLMTDDAKEADKIARRLSEINDSRKMAVADWQAVVDDIPKSEGSAVVAYLPDVPVGVLGLLAGSIVEKHHVPALVMSLDQDGLVRGSGRSMAGYLPLPELLASLDGLVERFGGHKEAAGWSLKPENVTEFIEAVQERLRPGATLPTHEVVVDALLKSEEATVKEAESIEGLAPFGSGNPEPMLVATGRLTALRSLGASGLHVKIMLEEYGNLGFVWFNHGQLNLPQAGNQVTLAGRLSVNRWREPEAQFVIEEASW